MLTSTKWWWAFCLFCAAVLTWNNRHSMNPDGLSYLDLASEASKRGPVELVNGYWSPAYPSLISAALFLFHPTADQEFPVVHVVNLLIFVFALFSFSLFYRYWSEMTFERDEAANGDKSVSITPFAFSAFLWFTLEFIGLEFVTPDLGVAAIVFLAAGIVCRLSLYQSNWKIYAGLGAVLGIGYCFKSAMFPLSLIFLTILFLLPPDEMTRKKLVVSMAAFLLTASPLLIAMSLRSNRFSFGEAGRVNYVWYVNGFLWNGGIETQAANQTPDHPAPKLLRTPLTLDFRSLPKGTYPPWYEPSYWYAGSTVRLDLNQQMRGIRETLRVYKDVVADTVAFFAGAFVLLALLLSEKRLPSINRSVWWQVAWPMAAFSLYALVHVERRFLGAFLVVFWLGVYGALASRASRRSAGAVCGIVLATFMLPFTVRTVKAAAHIPESLTHPATLNYQRIGQSLRDLGLRDGDQMAVVGYAYDCYYARYDRLRIAAQIPDARSFWQLSPAESEVMVKRLSSIGVKAIVARNRPDGPAFSNWKDIWGSGSGALSVLILPSKR